MALPQRVTLICLRSHCLSKLLINRPAVINKQLRNLYCGRKLGKREVECMQLNAENEGSKYISIGEELAGKLDKKAVNSLISDFFKRPELSSLVVEHEIEDHMFSNAKMSFLQYCTDGEKLSTDLHIMLSDLINGHGHVLDIFPFFYQHVLFLYPHLKFKNELGNIGDLRDPINWYPRARNFKRTLIFHYGPTNSGKTYAALQRFYESKKGVYCAPLKLLANEIFEKSNEKGVPCDLVTGEEKKRASKNEKEAEHISCTVEMLSIEDEYDVAVIDEVQMLKDPFRGCAWTRAFLGVVAKEVHLCGEESALRYIETMAQKMGESLQVHKYKRLTKLYLENKHLGSLANVKEGDCIICFSKKEIFSVTAYLEDLGVQCAVIYGTLPPGTKSAQAKLFNDVNNKCSVLVATDAVGLGMNLNIRRIIFYSLEKCEESQGDIKRIVISPSLALQIAGRAGRYKSHYPEGYVTTRRKDDLETLKNLLATTPEPVLQAGLHPTSDQIEMFSYYLPDMSLKQLIDIFMSISKLDDSLFFLCDLSNFKRLAEYIKHLPLSLKTMYTFCSAPVNNNSPLTQSLFVQVAKKFSENEAITLKFMLKFIQWPLKRPQNMQQLIFLEEVFDCLDLYLWLGNRYPQSFPDTIEIKKVQREIDDLITEGVPELLQLARKRNTREGSDSPQSVQSDLEQSILKKGILSPEVMAQLKMQWKNELMKEGNENKNNST